MKRWQIITLLASLAASPVLAQQAPTPRPLPQFLAPVVEGAAPSSVPPPEGQAPATRTVATIPIGPQANAAPDETAVEAAAAIAAPPQQVTLTAQVTDGSGVIGDGVVWRIFSSRPDASGQLELAAKSDNAVAQVQLAPGNYVVHVAYGRAQASDTIIVADSETSKQVVLDAGGLRLNAAVTGDVPIPINLTQFDIFTSGQSDADRELVVQNLGANDIVTLNAGTYHIVSYFGTVNAVVRADLRVEPGQLTDATLYHRAAQVSFKLVSEAGGEAIADVDWTISMDGATVFTNTGAFPSTVLQEGDYQVLAKRGEQVFNREFQVMPGGPEEIEVLTAVY